MKPILYNHSETSFTNNGLGRLADCISCVVTEERNGIYECQFTYPVTGAMYSKIQIGCILGVIHDDAKDIQPFDIYAKDAPMNGVVTFYAHHISYRLGHVILMPFSASSITAAFAAIPNKTYNSCQFTFWTDKSVSATWKVEVPSAVKAVLGGVEGSILDVYGKGEYEWDKFAVKLHLNRGNDNGVSIRYGVNLSDLNQSFDVSESYNAVAPYWKSDDGTLVTLPEGYIAASSVQNGEEIIPVPLDLSSEFDDQPTVAQLRAEAQLQLDNSEAWIPNENISVKFIDLAHTQEYKDIAALQRVRLCDKVSVYCGPLGVNVVKMQIIKTVYNVLLEEYDEIELGTAKTSFADTLMAKVSDVTGDLPTTTEIQSMLRQAVDEATDQITGAQNSHVRFIYDANGSLQEIVILDTDDITTATKVWRWNSGGLGYSSNGYAGPYSLAMTQNGAIVADFITTGTLTAALIRAGVLQDANGYNVWNLETGEFRLASTTTVGGSTVAAIAQDKVDDLDDALNQQAIFNRLTNNGATQGIYLKNGRLYINATYIDTGTLIASVIKAGILSDSRGLNSWNLETGEFQLASATTVGGSTVASIAESKASAAASALDNSLTQQAIFNRLTNNGQTQGIYLSNGLLYINASYINTGTMSATRILGGTLTLGGANNANGVLTIKDASGNTIGTWDNNGLTLNKGSINLNNGVFNVTNAGALTASNASLKGAFQTTGTDIWGNTINTRIASGKIRMFGSTDIDGDVQSWQPHAYLYIRALGGSSPETSIGAFVSDFEIYCAGYLDQHAGTLTLSASDGDYDHSNERGNVTIEAADICFMDNSSSSTPLVKFIGSALYGGGGRYVDFNVPVNVYSSFTVASGYTKSKAVTTDQYADRLLYCYETPSPLFGDVGEGVIGDDGLCYVTIDPIFAQTITTNNYQVFLQRYGVGDCYVKERRSGWFVVAGTPGLTFGWEIKGKQADVDQRRLDKNEDAFSVPKNTYGEDAAQHIEDIRKEREVA